MKGIGKRIAIGFISIVALLFISGMISLFELGNLSNDTDNILSASKRNMEFAKDMIQATHNHSRATLDYALFNGAGSVEQLRASLSDMEKLLAVARKEVYDTKSLDSLALSAQILGTVTNEYVKRTTRTLQEKVVTEAVEEEKKLSEEGTQEAENVENSDGGEKSVDAPKPSLSGQKWYATEYEPVYLRMLDQIDLFVTENQMALSPRAMQLNKNAYRSVAPVFVSLIVMIAIVLMFFYFTVLYCILPITRMNKALDEYLTYRLPYRPKSEMLDEVKELNDKIESLINQTKQSKQ